MINFETLYERELSPIKEALHPEDGELYFTSEGHAVKRIAEDEYELVEGSPLVYGEKMEDLTEKQLGLFWSIFKKRYKDE